MSALTILAPHRDDAAFSLFGSLCKWVGDDVKLRVINFFTVSAYGPRASSQDRSTISRLRSIEDRYVLRLAGRRFKLKDLGLLDAPLRFGISADSVCTAGVAHAHAFGEVASLSRGIRKYSNGSLILAPLGLGNHVDHLVVRDAAIGISAGPRLGFYEDLPYATWTPDPALTERVSDMETKTRVRLRPAVIRFESFIPIKSRAITYYRSQIGRSEALAIARFGAKYGGGERIWIPKHSERWRTLIH